MSKQVLTRPVTSAPASPASSPVDAAARPRPAKAWLLPALALAAVGGFGAWLVTHWGIEETDNAQLQAHLLPVSSRVPGTIAQVAVQDDQEVAKGQMLVVLDDRDARARLFRAQADLVEAQRQAEALKGEAGSSINGAQAAAAQAAADRMAAEAELRRSGSELQRLEFLLRQGGVSQQEVDRARASFLTAQSQLAHSQASGQQAQVSRLKVGVDRQKAGAAQARVMQAQAAAAEAALQLSYTRIQAPSPGRIGARQAEPGRQVQPGQPLMTLVDPHPWVEAHFKETQLSAVRPGQNAEVRLDAFPGRVFHGRVASLAPASGARFTLLPPDNATGNFTKVVQRVTTRINLDPRELEGLRLVPGLSASVRLRRP